MSWPVTAFDAWINRTGYAGVFVVTVAGNLGVPALGTAVMVLMLRFLVSPEWWVAAAVAAAGETTGQLAQYCMARFGARAIVEPFSARYSAGPKRQARFEAFYRKYGSVAVLICRFIPGVKAFSGFPAGLAKMALAPFLSYTLVGSSVCWLALSWVLHEAGGRSPTVSGFARQHGAQIFVALLGLLLLLAGVRRILRRVGDRGKFRDV
ncbi:MAG: VTT domain-containing protein [Acidobacteriaceae bacterium]|nr:VTT domain-containing protein [Acidobacteriaceae bacterium]